MKKKIIVLVLFLSVLALFGNTVVQPKTTKHKIKDRSSAIIYMTEIYGTEYWTEFYLLYEEDVNAYDESEAEKIIFEFISQYKVDHKFSTVEVEDARAANEGKEKITLLKRVIFRQLRK